MISGILRYFTPRVSAKRTREVFRSRRRFMTAFVARDCDAAVKEMERNLKKVHRFYLLPARSRHGAAAARSVEVAIDRARVACCPGGMVAPIRGPSPVRSDLRCRLPFNNSD